MRTIGRHRHDLEALVAPVLAALGSADGPSDGLEARLVDDLAAEPAAGQGYRVLGRAVRSPIPLPPFDNSQMDGFAVRAAAAGSAVRVVAPIPAGLVPPPLPDGAAAPIMTGARMPEGADAVFPVEATAPGSFPAALALDTVDVPGDLAVGTFVRRAGSDLAAEALLAEAGALVTPALLGVLAAAGVTSVDVVRRPRVLVVSTGSELPRSAPPLPSPAPPLPSPAPPLPQNATLPAPGDGIPLRDAADVAFRGPGTLRPDVSAEVTPASRPDRDDRAASTAGASVGDANGVSLRAALAEVGVEARAVRVPDDVDEFLTEVTAAVGDWADLVVTTGGISMGAYEVVREALEPRGLAVTPVAMQPGGPQASGPVTFGARTVPVVAFPGNPVSALVSFEVFLRPLLARHAGVADRQESTLPAAEAATSPENKHQVRRGAVVDGAVRFVGGPSSHLIAHYAEATHLVHVPVGVAAVAPGDPLTVWRIR